MPYTPRYDYNLRLREDLPYDIVDNRLGDNKNVVAHVVDSTLADFIIRLLNAHTNS